MKTIYEITYNGQVYEIKSKPLSYKFAKYLTKTMAGLKDAEADDRLLTEIFKESGASYRIQPDELIIMDMETLPVVVITTWVREILGNVQASISIQVKQEKN